MDNELAQLFLKYDYTETKDLSKQFLTLVVAVLVFSLTFSEKIVEFRHASTITRTWLVSAWTAFILSIILCGLEGAWVCQTPGVLRQNHVRVD
jgi:hypothetical protein